MSYNIENKAWLIGAGYMGIEYAKVLKQQKVDFEVIGRSKESALSFTKETGVEVKTGGVENILQQSVDLPNTAIVAVGVDQLAPITMLLLKCGIKRILVEKPAGLNYEEISLIADESIKQKADVFVAYNRRFYSSVIKAKEIIAQDGGVTSFNFEFTEWSHVIKDLKTSQKIKEKWFLANSTHVVDLAFYLGGKPIKISSFTAGSLEWHPSGSIFSGAGVTKDGALFSYQANWEAPGRWGVEMLTRKHRLILRPMEKLYMQKIGSLVLEEVEIDDNLDQQFKPGLYRQIQSFLIETGNSNLVSINEQYSTVNNVYQKMLKLNL